MLKKCSRSGIVFILLVVLVFSLSGFAADAPAPREYVFFMDISESVNREGFASAKTMMENVANGLADGESISVYTFASELTKVLDGCSDAEEACAVIDSIELVPGNTRFYKSMIEAFNQDENAICFVISDGVECHDGEPAVNSLEEVLAVKEESTVPVYGLCSDSIAESDYAEFKTLTEDSGGFMYLSNDEMKAFSEDIFASRPIVSEEPEPESTPKPTPEPTPEPVEEVEPPAENAGNFAENEPNEAETDEPENGLLLPVLIAAIAVIAIASAVLLLRRKKKSPHPSQPEEAKESRKKAENSNVLFYFDNDEFSDKSDK